MSHRSGVESCLIVGAGMAGLLAARRLRERGLRVTVLDKGRGVGGRMATRQLGEARFDHGAQFITVRDPAFGKLAADWLAAGVLCEWFRSAPAAGARVVDHGHPRYRGANGMRSIAEHLCLDLDVRTGERVVSLSCNGRRWQAQSESGTTVAADALVLTPPVPQTLALLDSSAIPIPLPVREELEAIGYEPCLAVMVRLSGPSNVPAPGGLRLSGEPLAWVADNRLKGISAGSGGLTLHAGPVFSRENFGEDRERVAQMMVAAAREWLGSEIIETMVHGWRYSQPTTTDARRAVLVPEPAPLVFAGDAFAGPRVEGAALSGLAAAEALLELSRESRP
jgi:predicted NAD/FAD-dependent oxidoreductase